MKMKLMIIGLAVAALAGMTAIAQTQSMPIPIQGNVFTFQGQSFLITTNVSGGLMVYTFGVQGTNTFVVPATPEQAMQVGTAWIEKNNPANIGYYNTNSEWVARIGAGYLQNSGQAVALLGVDYYGLFNWPSFGVGGGILEGNNGGAQGTAGAYGELLYRKPIGDVAGEGGLVAGYDNWNREPFVGPAVGLEYRENAHLGQWLKADYAFEPGAKNSRGLGIYGGFTYAF